MSENYQCRSKNCNRSFDTWNGRNSHEGHMHSDEELAKYQDKEWLYEQYHNQRKSSIDIANKLNVNKDTVTLWLRKFNIERRDYSTAHLRKYARFDQSHHGYEIWTNIISTRQAYSNGEGSNFPVHRLLAIAEYGVDEVAGKDVHHKNGIPWDNRSDNIELLSRSEHATKHGKMRGE